MTLGALIRGGAGNWEGLTKGSAYTVLTGEWHKYSLVHLSFIRNDWRELIFAVTNVTTLTLTATSDYNLTVPETGTAALLNQSNSFTLINYLGLVLQRRCGPPGPASR